MAKKITAILILCAALFSTSQAQKIESGSKWWDGYALWTATCEGNSIVMNGEEPNGDMDFFQIYKLNGKDEYAFTSDRPYFNKFNADLSCTLKYMRKDGMYFIVRKFFFRQTTDHERTNASLIELGYKLVTVAPSRDNRKEQTVLW